MSKRSLFNRRLVSGAITAIIGSLMALPWLDQRLFPATWLGMIMLISLTAELPAYLAFRRWLLAGMVHVAAVLHWYPRIVADTLNVSLFSGFMVVLLVITWDAFRFGVFGYLVGWIGPRGPWACFVWPVVWTGLEFVWPHIFPWRLGHTQFGWLSFMQLAEGVGVYGVSFLMVWGAAACALLLRSRSLSSHRSRSAAMIQLVGSGLVMTVATLWGTHRIEELERAAACRPQQTIALIQPGKRGSSMRATLQGLSRRARETADIIVWPESAIDDFSPELTSFASREEVERHAGTNDDDLQPMPGLGRTLVCGGGTYLHGTEGASYNTAFLIDPQERIIGRYHKRYLMPWGEYVAGQQYVPGVEEWLGTENARPGNSADPLESLEGNQLGVLICYEDLLSEPARETVQAGAQVLINLNNLSAFQDTPAMWGHQQIARMRAIETRRTLLRCGLCGSTTVISATGRVLQQAPAHVPATLVAKAPLLDLQTVYVRRGDLFAWSCLVLTGLFVFGQLRSGTWRATQPTTGEGQN